MSGENMNDNKDLERDEILYLLAAFLCVLFLVLGVLSLTIGVDSVTHTGQYYYTKRGRQERVIYNFNNTGDELGIAAIFCGGAAIATSGVAAILKISRLYDPESEKTKRDDNKHASKKGNNYSQVGY